MQDLEAIKKRNKGTSDLPYVIIVDSKRLWGEWEDVFFFETEREARTFLETNTGWLYKEIT